MVGVARATSGRHCVHSVLAGTCNQCDSSRGHPTDAWLTTEGNLSTDKSTLCCARLPACFDTAAATGCCGAGGPGCVCCSLPRHAATCRGQVARLRSSAAGAAGGVVCSDDTFFAKPQLSHMLAFACVCTRRWLERGCVCCTRPTAAEKALWASDQYPVSKGGCCRQCGCGHTWWTGGSTLKPSNRSSCWRRSVLGGNAAAVWCLCCWRACAGAAAGGVVLAALPSCSCRMQHTWGVVCAALECVARCQSQPPCIRLQSVAGNVHIL